MKRIFFFIAAACVFSSCYKEECHSCITQITRNGITQPNSLQQTYCGLTKKEIKEKETERSRYYYDSSLGRTVYEYIATHCDAE